MADKTWVGGTSDDAAVDANWSPSGVPATNDRVTIPDASTTSNDCRLTAATSWGTLTIATDGILVGNGQTLTLNGGVNDGGTAADFNYTDAGQTSNVSGNLDITMRNLRSSGDRAIITAAANNIRNLKIDDFTADGGGTGKVYHFQCHLTISGNLTVEYGELNTAFSSTSYNLTVAGTTTIGPGSGAADQATLTCNSSTVSLGALRQQADYAVNIENGGTFTGGTGTHTFGSLFMSQSATAKATMTTGQVKVNGYNNSANKAWRVEYGGDTFDNANGTVMFQFNGFDSRMSMRSESHANNAFHNLIIHMNGDTRQISPDNGNKIRVDNDLTITRGKLVMGLNHELDVGRDIVIDDASDTAVLEMGSSSNISSQPVTARSITIGSDGTYEGTSGTTIVFNTAASSYAFLNSGTYTPQGGTLQIGNGTTPSGGATHIRSNNYHHLTINTGENAPNGNVPWRPNTGTEVTIAGNLTVTKGRFYRNNSSNSLVVTGDVDIAANGQVGTSSASGSNTFGSLTIASGGTYLATSGTTTITSNTATGTRSVYNNGGTFTHNNGTLKINTSANTNYDFDGDDLYNFTVQCEDGSGALNCDGEVSTAVTVLNNLDIKMGILRTNANSFTIHGNVFVRETSLTNKNKFVAQGANQTVKGLITVEDGAFFDMQNQGAGSFGTLTTGGIRVL